MNGGGNGSGVRGSFIPGLPRDLSGFPLKSEQTLPRSPAINYDQIVFNQGGGGIFPFYILSLVLL